MTIMAAKNTTMPTETKASEPEDTHQSQELDLDELAGVAGGTQVVPKIEAEPVPHKHVANVKWTS
jgi:hypothetical protein